jgi:hypothetical protein
MAQSLPLAGREARKARRVGGSHDLLSMPFGKKKARRNRRAFFDYTGLGDSPPTSGSGFCPVVGTAVPRGG